MLGKGGAGLSIPDGLGGIPGIAGLGGSTGGEGPSLPPGGLLLVLVLGRGTGRVCPRDGELPRSAAPSVDSCRKKFNINDKKISQAQRSRLDNFKTNNMGTRLLSMMNRNAYLF